MHTPVQVRNVRERRHEHSTLESERVQKTRQGMATLCVWSGHPVGDICLFGLICVGRRHVADAARATQNGVFVQTQKPIRQRAGAAPHRQVR